MKVLNMTLELIKVRVKLHLSLVKVVVRLLLHRHDDHRKLVGHQFHTCVIQHDKGFVLNLTSRMSFQQVKDTKQVFLVSF